ncbi:hypothetical protein PILCRDRAFT_782108 [Piloderma croceum F 1598]|uniref:Uncharacterized protein n=1 Tax=Piloderma croceum (strain F 1598) TaxID=765440 RepID=A0A0C3G032_PILCF|nr:hypothetical protein PILCRDRAFT_782108 [Piloderma croceum F 1598]
MESELSTSIRLPNVTFAKPMKHLLDLSPNLKSCITSDTLIIFTSYSLYFMESFT